MFGMQTTVNDRLKNNGGYIAGPNHALMGASAAPPAAATDPGAGGTQAPNYRECDDATQCCNNCDHNDPQTSMCNLYNFKDSPAMVCDSWEPVGGADQGQEGAEGDGGMDDSGMAGGGATLG